MPTAFPKLILLFLFICAFICLDAQIKFIAKFSPATIGKEELTELNLLFENAQIIEQINPPQLDQFIILNGPVQKNFIDVNNKNGPGYAGISYLLKPKKKGVITVPPCTAKADGKTFISQKITLKVVDGRTGNSAQSNSPFTNLMPFDEPPTEKKYPDYILKNGENISDKINRNIFIKVETNTNHCYVGEPVLATYKLYTRLKSESNIVKNPAFNGFSVIDLSNPGHINYVTEKYQGREYNVYAFRKAQLFPLQAGQFELETASMDNELHFVKEEYFSKDDDLFSSYFQQKIPEAAFLKQNILLQSQPVFITVKPLPAINKPTGFSGAVGNFRMNISLQQHSISTDDIGTLLISISGSGNLPLINAPEINWPTGFEVYETKMNADLDNETLPVSGNKKFEYTFNISKPGSYVLPVIDFVFFDPALAKYKTISSKQLQLQVVKGNKKSIAVASLKSNENSNNINRLSIWLLIIVITALIIGLLIWIRSKKLLSKEELVDVVPILAVAAKIPSKHFVLDEPLALSYQALQNQNSSIFYKTIDMELHRFLATALQLDIATMSSTIILDAVDASGLSTSNNLLLKDLLDEIAAQLYSPLANKNKMQQHFVTALALVNLIKKQQLNSQ